MTPIEFNVYTVTALPSPLPPSSVFFVSPPGTTTAMEVYVTDAAGNVAHRGINAADVNVMISNAIAGANEMTVVNNIAARQALLPLTTTKLVYVVDATGDSTVTSGGATYLYNPATSAWIKTSEAESLDVVFNWASIVGGPTSSAAAIDAAVAASHTHANMTQLNNIGESAAGNFTYKGNLPVTGWAGIGW